MKCELTADIQHTAIQDGPSVAGPGWHPPFDGVRLWKLRRRGIEVQNPIHINIVRDLASLSTIFPFDHSMQAVGVPRSVLVPRGTTFTTVSASTNASHH